MNRLHLTYAYAVQVTTIFGVFVRIWVAIAFDKVDEGRYWHIPSLIAACTLWCIDMIIRYMILIPLYVLYWCFVSNYLFYYNFRKKG